MKRIGLVQNELEILETALIQYGVVVEFDQLSSLFNEDRRYTRKRIARLEKQGWLKRIKKGVYVISDLSPLGGLPVSHLAVVNILVQDAYISFEAALQHHGLFDQLLTSINSVSVKQYKTTKIDGINYHFIKTQDRYLYGWDIHEIDGLTVKVARLEKALIDLIQFHRSRYSTDLVVEKLMEYIEEIDPNKLVEYGLRANITTRRILGFIMDMAGLETSELLTSVENSQSTSAISNTDENIYNNKWRLYYDPYFEKYINE